MNTERNGLHPFERGIECKRPDDGAIDVIGLWQTLAPHMTPQLTWSLKREFLVV